VNSQQEKKEEKRKKTVHGLEKDMFRKMSKKVETRLVISTFLFRQLTGADLSY
jgi:hypothetical protein